MLIPSRGPSSTNSRRAQRSSSVSTGKVALLLAVTAIVAGLGIHAAITAYFPQGVQQGLWRQATARGFANLYPDYRLREAYKYLPTYMARMTGSADFPRMSIDIEFLDMQKLGDKRMQALNKGVLETADEDYVSGWVRTDGKRVKVKLRLKGDDVDHLVSADKWSLRIHVSGNEHLWGLRSFSIQHPMTRGFHGEILFQEMFRPFGIITPRYFFVNVTVNGNDIGIMAVEEFFAKELLEANGRKESVIIKFDEFYRWNSRDMRKFRPDQVWVGPFESHLNADIDAFQSSKISKSEVLQADLRTAIGLLRGFLRGRLSASDVFDVNLLGSYLAVAEFWGAAHEVHWTNLRFYFNPLTGRLEPVPFDGNIHHPIPANLSISLVEIAMDMLEDPKVFAVYRRTFESLVESWKSGDLIKRLRDREQGMLAGLQSEFFFLEEFSLEQIEQRIKHAPRALIPHVQMEKTPIFARALLVLDDGNRYLELLNPLPFEVKILNAYWVDGSGLNSSFESTERLDFPIHLPGTPSDSLARQVRIPYIEPKSDVPLQLKLRTSVTGYEEEREAIAQVGYPALSSRPFPSSNLEEQLRRHAFLSVDAPESAVRVAPGVWDVDGDILLPEGYEVRLIGGTTLRFDTDAVFVINGTAKFGGTADRKIVLEGKPGADGTSDAWQGMAVFNAPQRSRWSHVVVRNTSSISREAWRLTGGVTFYKSDVDILDSTFEDVFGEDALNIVHSDFKLTNVEIRNTVSDGFDADFTTGVIERGIFREIGTSGGGDAADFSGSEVEIVDSRFEGVRDKAISVGEGSQLEVKSVYIDGTGVGIASKDNSETKVEDVTIRNARFAGLMAYMKKPEYGPATLVANNTEIVDTPTPTRLQTGSTLTLNGESITAEAIDVDSLYETVMKSGIEK